MENEKNEMKKKPGKVLPWLAAVLLAAALAARAAVPVPAGLFTQIWNIGTQLIILFSGLVLFSAAARAVFQRVSPSSNHGKTVFTLADSAIRYLLIIVGLLWALSIVGVDVRALLAGAGVLALILKALWSMYRQCPKSAVSYVVMAAAFLLTAFLSINVLFVILGCAAFGLLTAAVTAKRNRR